MAKPHKALLLLKLEVHDILDTGECSGKIVDAETLAKYGLKSKSILEVSGESKELCLKKLKELLDGFK